VNNAELTIEHITNEEACPSNVTLHAWDRLDTGRRSSSSVMVAGAWVAGAKFNGSMAVPRRRRSTVTTCWQALRHRRSTTSYYEPPRRSDSRLRFVVLMTVDFLGALVASAVHGRLHLPPPDCRRLAPTLFTAILHDHLDIVTFVSPEFLAGGCCRRNTDSLSPRSRAAETSLQNHL